MTTDNQPFGKYQRQDLLGYGGFAEVYRATDTDLGRSVALKVLKPILLSDPGFIQRFQREAQTAAQLRHPHIVTIYEMGEVDGRYYIAMDLIPGPSLREYLRQHGKLSWDETMQIMTQVCSALDYAHRQGVVHRDLKPANILLDPQTGAVLTDFGFARLVGENSQMSLSASGGVVGTPAYIPVEVWEGEKATAAADVYALGCMVYEMLTGKMLFSGETPIATMRQHDHGAEFPETWSDDFPAELTQVLTRALSKDPAQRPANAGDFLKELTSLSTEPEIFEAKPIETTHPLDTSPQKSSWLKVGIGIGLLFVLLSVGLMMLSSNNNKRSLPTEAVSETTIKETSSQPTQIIATNTLPPEQTETGSITSESKESTEPAPTTTSENTANTGDSEYIHTVLTGETTHDIACRFGLSAEELASYNNLENQGRTIEPGDQLSIPLGQEIKAGKICTFVLPESSLKIEMAYVPAGSFMMGSDSEDAESDEAPVHEATTDGYWIDRTEVTNAQFEVFIVATGYETTAEKDGGGYIYSRGDGWDYVEGANWLHPKGSASQLNNLENHPVVLVSWEDANNFCHWRNTRLPTEIEWEKAAKGVDIEILNFCDSNCPLPWASNDIDDGYQRTSPVGSYSDGASFYNVLDMIGNVWEWTNSWYDAYPGNTDDNDSFAKGYMVLRGGSWNTSQGNVRVSDRESRGRNILVDDMGFRCASILP